MDDDFKRREARRQTALKRLGCDDPRCFVCGETYEHCLELHHVFARKNDDAEVILCRNCHRKATDKQADHPKLDPLAPDYMFRVLEQRVQSIIDLLVLFIGNLRALSKKLTSTYNDGDENARSRRDH